MSDSSFELIVRCKDCKYRYEEDCPLFVVHDFYDEDDGYDYYFTYGASEDDTFFCAYGEQYVEEEGDETDATIEEH